MKNNYYFKSIFVALILLTGACSKNTLNEVSPESDAKTSMNGRAKRSAGDGKYDLLGYGYDVTGEYANSSASRFSVIDVEALDRDHDDRVEEDLSSKQEPVLIAGENAKSYLEKLSLRITQTVGIPLFKSTIKAAFSDSNAFSSKYVYSSFSQVIQQKRLKINATNELLKTYLKPTFISDVNSSTPKALVVSYGTHVLVDIILGAKLEVMYQSETSKTDRTEAASAGVDVSVKSMFGINTGNSYTSHQTTDNFSQKLHYRTYGGEPSKSLMGNISLGAEIPKISITEWQGSSSVENAELIGFGNDKNKESLIPIYEFIQDPIKKAEVKAYVDQYLKDNQVTLINEPLTPPTKLYAAASYSNTSYQTPNLKADVRIDFYNSPNKTLQVPAKGITVNYRIVSISKQNNKKGYYDPASIYADNVNSVLIGRRVIETDNKVINGNWYYGTREIVEILPGTGYEPINDMK